MQLSFSAEQKTALLRPGRDDGPEALGDALAALPDTDDVRAVVLSISGSLGPGGKEGECDWLERFVLPAVAALSGTVDGRALDLALACDMRVCDAATVIRFGAVGGRRSLALLGEAGSLELLRLGLRLDAEAALRLGVVSAVAQAGASEREALELAATIASRGPIATRLAKEAVWQGLELPLAHALRFETDLTLLLQTTKDRAEGVAAFLEKRTPRFTGN